MGRIIRQFNDGSFLEYDRGKFDDLCVYFTDTNGRRKPLRDIDYFQQLKEYGQCHGNSQVYDNYTQLYERTGKEVDVSVFCWIHDLCMESFKKEGIEAEVLFSILYMAMISEEKKRNTKLGKRIKRLGVHKLLIEGKDIYEAANFMKGMKWRDIDQLCKERGF